MQSPTSSGKQIREHTLILIKPDAIEKDLHLTILARLEHLMDGSKYIASRILRFDPDLCKQHYSHLTDEPFYKYLETYMCSGNVWAAILEGPEGLIEAVRNDIGATDPTQAKEGTIRNKYGEKINLSNGEYFTHNAVHSSESQREAYVEIKRLFLRKEIQNTMPDLAAQIWPKKNKAKKNKTK